MGSIVLVGEGFLIRYMMNRFIQVTITTSPTGLQYTSNRKDIFIPFADIRSLQFPSAAYLGGWIKINGPSDSIRLTVVLENISSLLQELKTGLDQSGNDSYDPKKFFNFLKTSAYSDQSWQRLYEIFWALMGSQILAFLLGWLISTILGPSIPLPGKIFLGFLSSLWVFTVYLLGEAQMTKQIEFNAERETFSVPERDKNLENAILRKGCIYGFLSYLVLFPGLIYFLMQV